MLTKDEILRKMNGFECPEYIVTPCWQPIYDQCVAAIDLATENELLKAKAKHYICIRERNRETIDDLKGKLNASESENERLKAKLDAVRAECEQSLQSSRGLSAKLSVLRLLEILDGEGDET